MKSLHTKKKLLGEKILESYFQEDGSKEIPQNLLNKKTVRFLTSLIDVEEDQDGFEIAEDYFDSTDSLLNITVQSSERGTISFKNI